ncbi:short-chain dehydrogenase/reductase [Xylariomycetidae sp. FL2044]|nr:short-chain dehydrogenase/reductase [Xylariomycetidae sp. FL2044]
MPKTILITGCGPSGIGAALATEFHTRGCRVFASGLPGVDLSHLAALDIETLPLDVTSQASIDGAVERIKQATGSKECREGRLDMLINNAGLLHVMPFTDMTLDDAQKVFDVNVLGVFAVTRSFIPLLRAAAQDGTTDAVVANLGSINEVLRPPFMCTYNASKAAVEAIGASMRTEIAPLGIRVVTLKTGSIDTGLWARAPVLPHDSIYAPIRDFIEGLKMFDHSKVPFMDVHEYAKQVVDELLRPKVKHVIWRGGLTTVAWILTWFGWEGILDGTLIRGHLLDRIGRH